MMTAQFAQRQARWGGDRSVGTSMHSSFPEPKSSIPSASIIALTAKAEPLTAGKSGSGRH
jgi:hypothetical protein